MLYSSLRFAAALGALLGVASTTACAGSARDAQGATNTQPDARDVAGTAPGGAARSARDTHESPSAMPRARDTAGSTGNAGRDASGSPSHVPGERDTAGPR